MDTIVILAIISNGLSFFGNVFVILTLSLSFFIEKTNLGPTTLYYRILLWLTSSNLVTTILTLVYPLLDNPPYAWCFVQALFTHVFDLSVSFWYTALIVELSHIIIITDSAMDPRTIFKRWVRYLVGNLLISLLIPFLLVCFYRKDLYTLEEGTHWCFIAHDLPLVGLFTYYLPQIGAWIGCFYYVIKVMAYTQRMTLNAKEMEIGSQRDEDKDSDLASEDGRRGEVGEGEEAEENGDDDPASLRGISGTSILSAQRRLLNYPFCFILLFSTSFVDRVYDWIAGDHIYFFLVLHIVCFSAEGFVNFILFVSSHNKMLKIWKRPACLSRYKCLCCCCSFKAGRTSRKNKLNKLNGSINNSDNNLEEPLRRGNLVMFQGTSESENEDSSREAEE